MNFSKVIFVNYFHNGDSHLSRQIVRTIMSNFPSFEYGYAHGGNACVLQDIPKLKFIPKASLPQLGGANFGSIIKNDVLYLNTWYGSYRQKYNCSTGVAFDALYNVFDAHLIAHFNTNLQNLESQPHKLFPKIDFSKFKINNIDKFIKDHKGQYKKYILFSNGPALSGQAANFSFAPIINALSAKHPTYLFIYTNINAGDKINKTGNIKTSMEIIGKLPCDLNENAYLSTFCNVIVGRTSGVYTFAMIQDNMFDRPATMVSFSNIGDDRGNYWLSHKFAGKIKYSAKVVNFKEKEPRVVETILRKFI